MFESIGIATEISMVGLIVLLASGIIYKDYKVTEKVIGVIKN